jgi:hypothetical protein
VERSREGIRQAEKGGTRISAVLSGSRHVGSNPHVRHNTAEDLGAEERSRQSRRGANASLPIPFLLGRGAPTCARRSRIVRGFVVFFRDDLLYCPPCCRLTATRKTPAATWRGTATRHARIDSRLRPLCRAVRNWEFLQRKQAWSRFSFPKLKQLFCCSGSLSTA